MSGIVWHQQAFHLLPDCSIREKICDDIHLLMRDADNTYAFLSNHVEENMLALREAAIALSSGH
jgi:hypothetical protein